MEGMAEGMAETVAGGMGEEMVAKEAMVAVVDASVCMC